MRHPDPHFGYPTVSWRAKEPGAAHALPPLPPHRFLRQGALLLDTHVDAIDLDSAARRILNWGEGQQSRVVTLCRAETLVHASRHRALHHVIAQADLALPGEAAVAWAMRREGQRRQQAVTPEALMWHHLRLAERAGQAVHFHGGNEAELASLLTRIHAALPDLKATSTPGDATPLSPAEDLALMHQITSTGAQVIFVGLGWLEQDRWMNAHQSQLRAVLVGLGPHFGTAPHAPREAATATRLRGRFATRAVFFARIVQNIVLGAPPSHHDDPH